MNLFLVEKIYSETQDQLERKTCPLTVRERSLHDSLLKHFINFRIERQPTWVDHVQPFIAGGISGMTATSVIQPIDTVKVRIQIESEAAGASGKKKNLSPFRIAAEIKAKEGIRGLYKGWVTFLVNNE